MINTIISLILLATIVATIIVRRTRIKTRSRSMPTVEQPTPAVPPTKPLPPVTPPQPSTPQPTQPIAPTPTAKPTPPATRSSDGIDGTWRGILNTGVAELTFELQIIDNNAGTLNATLSCLEQETNNTPIDSITLQDKTLAFAIKSMRITYEGVLSKNQQTIEGTFTQFGQHFPLTFTRKQTP